MIPFGSIEEWRGAVYQGVDYGWRFEVSTWGRLRNAKTGHVYSFGYGDGGYLQACISINGKRLNVHVHRCVAETAEMFGVSPNLISKIVSGSIWSHV